jgi:hypothetical protein
MGSLAGLLAASVRLAVTDTSSPIRAWDGTMQFK